MFAIDIVAFLVPIALGSKVISNVVLFPFAIGVDGIADNVRIMSVRCVPDGDERDKDVANAIRYAVDNGAKVINGSFGKSFSPHKQWVYDAIKYAAKKDVLIVHAAGNDGYNIDIEKNINYPNDSEDNIKEFADNLITIGAINKVYGEKVVAGFSNFGKINVDVFAPGEEIYATVPNNKYKYLQGTSMAAPNAAGVAALIRSYYPKLKAAQVKQILMESGVALPAQVVLGENPNPDQEPVAVSSAESSKTAKMVNRALGLEQYLGVWCNWQHGGFWYLCSWFESRYPSKIE